MVDRCSQAANPRLEKTTYSRSPQMQKSDVQEINEDIPQTHKIYHFQNCGTVYMDSFNARGVRMKNCGNNVPQVTCSLFFFSFLPHFFAHLTRPYYITQIIVLGLLAMRKFHTPSHNPMQSSMVCGHLHHLLLNMLDMYSLLY